MRIWSQSCGAFGKDPIWRDYEESCGRYVRKIAKPDTVVDFHGVNATIPGTTTTFFASEECARQAVTAAVRAEREGYDAYIMQSTLDPGHYAIKEMVNIPVVLMMETSLSLALMLGHKFSFLTISPIMLLRLADKVKQYGLAERMVQGGCLDIDYSEMLGMFKNPPPYIEKITKAVKEIVKRGADIIYCSPTPINMFCLEQGIKEVDGAHILDNFGCLVKMAELMVDLKNMGIIRSKHGLYAAPSKEVLAALQRDYMGLC
ncbi:aspartate/glutamate racemase family protein [Chloroflexota bacterium]